MYMHYIITKLAVPSSFYFFYKILLKIVRYFGALREYYFSVLLSTQNFVSTQYSTPRFWYSTRVVLLVLGTLLHSTPIKSCQYSGTPLKYRYLSIMPTYVPYMP